VTDYLDFIARKAVKATPSGFAAGPILTPLFPFQRQSVQWALRQGRAALFLDTGLGKTRCQLEWARQVTDQTGRPVLILAPLAVAQQTVREARACGLGGVGYATDAGAVAGLRTCVTNYERLGRFNTDAFGGVVLDESSILKAYSGTTKRQILEAFAVTPYKLACSATPAPNDHLELGNHAEFLSVMSSHEMIARWFINDTSQFGTYRLKGHAVEDFWDWVSSWAVMASRPSDLGDYADEGYVLPALQTHVHTVDVNLYADEGSRTLFRQVEMNATSIHAERRRTAADRAARVAQLVAAEPEECWLVWCETDYEADALMAALGSAAVEVRGSDSLAQKEDRLVGFSEGRIQVLVTKPKIAGFGLNWQHCARVAFVGATFSFESYYQAIRRTWRFGQRRPVHVHVVMAETERPVWAVLDRKRQDFDAMKAAMFTAALRNRQRVAASGRYRAATPMALPIWHRRRAG